jgi:hypothetical protein
VCVSDEMKNTANRIQFMSINFAMLFTALTSQLAPPGLSEGGWEREIFSVDVANVSIMRGMS